MPDLSFRIRDAAPLAYTAVPTIAARLEIANATPEQPVGSISLNCQVQIEPLARPYTAYEEARLLDLFGERERWARSMKPLLWTITVLKVPGFRADASLDLPLPCTLDFDVAATKYFYGLEQGHIAVSVLFSGTIFYAAEDGSLQIEQIPWDREARFQLPVQVWQDAIRAHYPDAAWLRLSKEAFDRLYRFKVARGIPAFDRLIEELLDQAERAELQDRATAAAEVVK
jgi:Family of unknown function (DUF6084)